MKRSRIPLKWNIFIILAGLVAIILALLWIFEFCFLDDFYRFAKERRQHYAVEQALKVVDKEDVKQELNAICLKEGVCLLVLKKDGTKLKAAGSVVCTVFQQSADSLNDLANRAAEAGGKLTEQFSLKELGMEFLGEEENKKIYSLLYAFVPEGDTDVALVVAETALIPQNSAFTTILLQLTMASVGVIILAGITTLVMSQMIAKPIEKLNATAKDLAKGKTDLHFEAEGYREIEELRDTLNYASKEISEAEHYRKELLANVSHDLRTPLTLIKGYGEMMRDFPGETTSENLQAIIDETERLTGLVNDLLEVGKLWQGAANFEFERMNLNRLTREIVNRIGTMLKGKAKLNLEESEDFDVVADEKKIEQVIYNLISNAVNYIGEDATVTVRILRHEQNVRLEVVDRGEGIDVSILPHIWDRYYKSEKAHKRAVLGTGLGLSIVKSVISMHPGGVYGVETTRGKGSNFYFELPIAEDDGRI